MAYTWEEDRYWSDPAVQAAFRGEPQEGSDRVSAKFAHLREEQRQIEAEERARGDLGE